MDEYFIVYLLGAISGLLSSSCTLFILIVYLKYNQLQTFSYGLVMTLLSIDFLNGISFVIPTFIHEFYLCQFQAFLIQFFGLASALWVGCMSLILYKQLNSTIENTKKYAKICFGVVCFVSFTISIVLACVGRYGEVVGHCWIKDENYGYLFRLAFLFGPIRFVFGFNLILYHIIIKEIKKQTFYSNELKYDGQVLIKRIQFYPVSMVLCSLPITLYRIIQIYYDNIWIYAVGVFLYALVGVSNSLIYGFNESVKYLIFKKSQDVERLVSID